MHVIGRHQRDPLAPHHPPDRLWAIILAVMVHAALLTALALGLDWKKSTTDTSIVEAELWAALPQEAAPRTIATPPPPSEPIPKPQPAPEPPAPEPEPEPTPPPPSNLASDADIALEREKKEQEERQHQQQLEQERLEAERRDQLEREKQLAQQKAEQERIAREKAEREQLAKAEQEKQKKLAEEKRRTQQAEAKRTRELRDEQMRRLANLANTAGGSGGNGNAQRSSGPSAGYGARVKARVKPNIVYPSTLPGNPRAEVEVRLAPDGTIVGVRLARPSNNPAWNEAVTRALHKTAILPRDVDGRVHSPLIIIFEPNE